MSTAVIGGRRERFLRSVAVLCSMWSAALAMPARAVDNLSEEAVKAAFVLRFASYVEWPEGTLPERRFTIAVLGAANVAVRLQQLVAGREILNRPVQVRRITHLHDARDAQIVYVGTDRNGDLKTLLAPLAAHGVLVISNEDAGLESGSTINLLVADHRVRFEVALEAARRSRLRISSELLALAVRVQK